MGRRNGARGREELYVNVPSYFRCPISLDVMKSPVSLCTGVTYDRSSIQTWLETGHNTCPATMQVLPTTDFVPNHTLHRLIQLWSSSSSSKHHNQLSSPLGGVNAGELLRRLQHSSDPLPILRRLAELSEESVKLTAADAAVCVPALNGILLREGVGSEEIEAAVRVLAVVLANKDGSAAQINASLSDHRTVSSILAVLKRGELDSRIAAASVLEFIASIGAESKLLLAETEGLLAELLHLVTGDEAEAEKAAGNPVDPTATDAALSCLVSLSSLRRVRPQIVRIGVIPALRRLLSRPSTEAAAAEKALKLMEAAATCTEGRAAICEDSGCVAAVVGRMIKVSPAATEHAVAVLWSVCHLFRDRRAQEAVVAGGNGLSKILLLLQSNCSPAARQMAGDLIRIFRVDSKSCLPSYDSRTTHITPF